MEPTLYVRRVWRVRQWWLRRLWSVQFVGIDRNGEPREFFVVAATRQAGEDYAVKLSRKLHAARWVMV